MNRPIGEYTWQYATEQYGYTPRKVAEEFVRCYWAKPREIERMDGDRFTVVNGTHAFKVAFVPEIYLTRAAMYVVIRLDPDDEETI
jgi:hypothetical protein